MKLSLSSNISRLRKEHSMTQEQLAEALGVTFASVSKWERGVATPELNLIAEIADLFEISIDALIGYEYRNHDRSSTVRRLKEYKHKRNPEELSDAEKALKKYPNNFEVVYCCAALYQVRGIEQQDERLLRRALELFERACLLFDQNNDESISVLSMRIDMATIYSALGDMDTSIELLKANNPCGINNARIGDDLSRSQSNPEQALPFLSKALLDCITNQTTIVTGYLNVFLCQKDFRSARDILRWRLETSRFLKRAEKPSFLDKSDAVLWVLEAEISLELGHRDEAYKALCNAREAAQFFDENPSNDADRVRFVTLSEQSSSYDNLGDTAVEAVCDMIAQVNKPELTDMWEVICDEK